MIKSYQKKLGSLALVSLLGSCAANIDEPPSLVSTPEVEYKTKKVESAVVTEVADYPQKRILRYVLAGGVNMSNWLEPIQETIEEFATNNYCQAVEVAGRKGWLRKLKGYKQKIYIMSKEL